MNAILAGSTGAVGRQLIYSWLNHQETGKLQALVRKVIPLIKEEKLLQVEVDWEVPEFWPSLSKAEIAFCCLGTTIKTAKTKEAFRRVDQEYVLFFARKALEAGVKTFVLVSAIGASANSTVFYSKVKGEVEKALEDMPFETLIIAQPSLLITPRQERRVGERLAQIVAPFLDFFLIGPLSSYHSVTTTTLSKALVGEALKVRKGVFRLHYPDFKPYNATKNHFVRKGQI